MDYSQLQRIEKILSKELRKKYKDLLETKAIITKYWELSVPDSSKRSDAYFSVLNYHKTEYRKVLKEIKNIEETQKSIRKILRK